MDGMTGRRRGSALLAVIVVLLLVSILGAGLVAMSGALSGRTPPLVDAAKGFYAGESGLALAASRQAGTTGPVPFDGAVLETARSGDVYTATASVGGGVVRVLTATVRPPSGAGGPLDLAASEGSATSGSFLDANAGKIDGKGKKIVLKLVNAGNRDLLIERFSLSSATGGLKLKKLETRTAANGWSRRAIFSGGGGAALPLSGRALNKGGAAERSIPAGSYVIIDRIELKGVVDGDYDFSLTLEFAGGRSSTLSFRVTLKK